MRHGVIAGRAALLVALWGFLPAAPARAQGTEPLRKVELVRLLGSAAVKRYVPGVVPARIRNVAIPRWSVMATGSRVSPPGTALAPRNITSTFGCGTAPL